MVHWDRDRLEFVLAIAMPLVVFGVLWQSYNRKATRYFAAGAAACAVANVLLSSPCGCDDPGFVIDRAIQRFGMAAAVVLAGRALLAWLFSTYTMPQAAGAAEQETVQGWLVPVGSRFKTIVGRLPPRPVAFWSLLRADLSSIGGSAFLITGAAVVLAGYCLRNVAVVGAGLGAFCWHGRMMALTLKSERGDDVRIGVIDALEPMHPALPDVFKATLACADGARFEVGGSRRNVARFLEEDGRVTVIALVDPKTRSGRVLGVRRWSEPDGGDRPAP